jgi:hypothetical protein
VAGDKTVYLPPVLRQAQDDEMYFIRGILTVREGFGALRPRAGIIRGEAPYKINDERRE